MIICNEYIKTTGHREENKNTDVEMRDFHKGSDLILLFDQHEKIYLISRHLYESVLRKTRSDEEGI